MNVFPVTIVFLSALISMADDGGVATERAPQKDQSATHFFYRPELSDATLEDAWVAYHQGHARYAVVMLPWLAATNVPLAIDESICRSFVATQNVDSALFLGLCKSPFSQRLLELALTNSSSDIAEASRLALARRGVGDFEGAFIARYAMNPISTNLGYALEDRMVYEKVVWPLVYIGSVSCVAVMFDGALTDEYRTENARVSFVDAQDIRDYLGKAGIAIPKEVVSRDDVIAWWKSKRSDILMELHKREANTLPRFRKDIVMCIL